jgi:general secretion pathway protein B
MSFILDALKKSEIERQRQSVPGLIDVPQTQKRKRLPWWAYGLAALLLVNVGVLSVLLLRNASAPKGQAARTASIAARPAGGIERQATETSAAKGDHFSPMDSPPVYAPEIPVQNQPASQERPAAAQVEQQPLSSARSTRRDPILSESNAADENDEVLPTFSELNLPAGQTLPELHLDVHVYGTKAADRFVYINMRKYREGQTLQEGPVLERIRRDGAVLNYKGVRFLLPRQS